MCTPCESFESCGFREEDFLCFSHDAHGVGPVWTPGARLAGFIKRITIHCYTQNMKALGLVVSEKKIFLHTKDESFESCGFREEDFYMSFPL